MISNRKDKYVFVLVVLLLLNSAIFMPRSWAGDVRTFDITAKEFSLEPDHLIVEQGQPVLIVFYNKGVMSHNLSIDDLGVKTRTIYPGETDRLTFTPDKAGKYFFHCTVPGHTEAGMRGIMLVR